jgi:hypothetical protein
MTRDLVALAVSAIVIVESCGGQSAYDGPTRGSGAVVGGGAGAAASDGGAQGGSTLLSGGPATTSGGKAGSPASGVGGEAGHTPGAAGNQAGSPGGGGTGGSAGQAPGGAGDSGGNAGSAGARTMSGGAGVGGGASGGAGACGREPCPDSPPADGMPCTRCESSTACNWNRCETRGSKTEAWCRDGKWFVDTFSCPVPVSECCQADTDCEDGVHCMGGSCEPHGPGQCWTPEDCGENQKCSGGQICTCGRGCGRNVVPGLCVADLPECCGEVAAECGPDICVAGFCKPWVEGGCWSDAECDFGSFCQGQALCPCGASCAESDRMGTCVPGP